MRSTRPLLALLLAPILVTGCGGTANPPASPSPAPGPVTVQPGAPGEPSRVVTGTQLEAMEGVSHTEADVRFMQGMIPHHAQALQMTALVPERAASRAVHQMALRMEISQRDEIRLMASWLETRGEEVPPSAALARTGAGMEHGAMDHAGMGHGAMAMPAMPGMLSPEQMQNLAAARGEDFDRLFLEYMIQHHRGALVMVDALFRTDGAAQESEVFRFASDVDADQRAEIARMQSLLDAR